MAVGGTFDEFHKGHRTLLTKAFEVGERVLIGLCSDKLVESLSKPHITAPYEQRLEELKRFLRERGLLSRAEIMPLNDPFGVTLSEGCVEALVVSRETERMAVKINEERERRGLAPLQIVVIDMVPSENHAPISTTRIRHGEIDREGRLLKTKENS
ncbi:pantetheine-phosphate adenylyltransferase [Candidatus Bathyarchaeota archaeon A05DMB-5]|nr:pantetheine-phosphate adenylyltransferase [Candidatus Bathyarchaeota archaeon A05DMB-5]